MLPFDMLEEIAIYSDYHTIKAMFSTCSDIYQVNTPNFWEKRYSVSGNLRSIIENDEIEHVEHIVDDFSEEMMLIFNIAKSNKVFSYLIDNGHLSIKFSLSLAIFHNNIEIFKKYVANLDHDSDYCASDVVRDILMEDRTEMFKYLIESDIFDENGRWGNCDIMHYFGNIDSYDELIIQSKCYQANVGVPILLDKNLDILSSINHDNYSAAETVYNLDLSMNYFPQIPQSCDMYDRLKIYWLYFLMLTRIIAIIDDFPTLILLHILTGSNIHCIAIIAIVYRFRNTVADKLLFALFCAIAINYVLNVNCQFYVNQTYILSFLLVIVSIHIIRNNKINNKIDNNIALGSVLSASIILLMSGTEMGNYIFREIYSIIGLCSWLPITIIRLILSKRSGRFQISKTICVAILNIFNPIFVYYYQLDVKFAYIICAIINNAIVQSLFYNRLILVIMCVCLLCNPMLYLYILVFSLIIHNYKSYSIKCIL